MTTTSIPTGHDARRVLLDLSAMHIRLEQVFDDLSHFERVWRPGEGKWSCAEVAGHLLDAEIAFGYRIRSALAEPGLTIGAFDPDRWVAVQRWNELPVGDTIQAFQSLRRATVVLLGPLDDEEWLREYIHSVRGPQSIAQSALLLASHDARHLVQLGRTAELAREASQRGTGLRKEV